ATWHGQPSRFGGYIEDHQCSHVARHRGRRPHDRRERGRTYAEAYRGKPAARDPQSRTLRCLGTASRSDATAPPVSRWTLDGGASRRTDQVLASLSCEPTGLKCGRHENPCRVATPGFD